MDVSRRCRPLGVGLALGTGFGVVALVPVMILILAVAGWDIAENEGPPLVVIAGCVLAAFAVVGTWIGGRFARNASRDDDSLQGGGGESACKRGSVPTTPGGSGCRRG